MTGLAKEYGEGLYELARDEGILQEVHDQLTAIHNCMRAQPDFIRLLCSRAVERADRLRVVEETFGGRIHPYAVNFMKLLVEREKFDVFEECVKWFHARYNDDMGIVEARVTSAVPLDEARQAALKARLEAISGKTVALMSHVDPSLIGGVRVEMDGRRYDNTIQNRLERLKREFARSF